VIAKPGWGDDGDVSSLTFHLGVAFYCVFCPLTFLWHKVNLLSLSSVILLFFHHLKSVITNLGWMSGTNPKIIWLHSSNILEILLVILLVNNFVLPRTFAWRKSNLLSSSSVLLFFYHLKSVIAKPRKRKHLLQHLYQGGGTNAFLRQLLHDTKSIFVIKFSSFIFSASWSQWLSDNKVQT